MADMICHNVYELLMSILRPFDFVEPIYNTWRCEWKTTSKETSTRIPRVAIRQHPYHNHNANFL
jgi:hypothetical protein